MKNIISIIIAAVLVNICLQLNAQQKTASGITVQPRNVQQTPAQAPTATPAAPATSNRPAQIQQRHDAVAPQKLMLASKAKLPEGVHLAPAATPNHVPAAQRATTAPATSVK